MELKKEPEFLNGAQESRPRNRFGQPLKPGGPARQPYLTYWPARLHKLAESIPWNRFLGSLNLYKFGLRYLKIMIGSERAFSIITC
jgi:hypothetical protein